MSAAVFLLGSASRPARPPLSRSHRCGDGAGGGSGRGLRAGTCWGVCGMRPPGARGSRRRSPPSFPSFFPPAARCGAALLRCCAAPVLPSCRNHPLLSQCLHCFQMMEMFLSLGFSSALRAGGWRAAINTAAAQFRGRGGKCSLLGIRGEEKARLTPPGCPEEAPCLCSESGKRDHSLRNIPMTSCYLPEEEPGLQTGLISDLFL